MIKCFARHALVLGLFLYSSRLFGQHTDKSLAPDIALSDGVAIVARADLSGSDLAGLRRAIERHLVAERDSDILFLRPYEIAQKKLLDAGVTTIVCAEANDAAEAYLRPVGKKKIEAVKTAVLESVRATDHGISSWGLELAEADGWLLAHPETQPPYTTPSDAGHRRNLQEALSALGKYPGLVFVATSEIRPRIDADLNAAKAVMPADLAAAMDLLLQVRWLAFRVRLDEKPTSQLIAALPDEKSAADLAAALPKLAAAALAMIDRKDGAGPIPPPLVALRIAQKLSATAKGDRVTIAAGAKPTLQILDLMLVARHRMAFDNVSPDLANMYYLRDWLHNVYPAQHGRWPKSLEDIKPLLTDDPKLQEKTFKKLLTDAPGEFPRFAYQQPEQPYNPTKAPAPFYERDPNTPRGAAILVEIKAGKPRPGGITLYENGDQSTNE